jgi:hypothetical protein
MNVAWRKLWDPTFRERMRKAAGIRAEQKYRELKNELDAEKAAVGGHRLIKEYRMELLAWGEALMPGGDMDASACYWFRRGLERAVKVLDDKVATAEERHAG